MKTGQSPDDYRETNVNCVLQNLLISFRIVAGQNDLDCVTNEHFTDLIKPYKIC